MKRNPLQIQIETYLAEDDLFRNEYYFQKLPEGKVSCEIKFKTENMICAGLPYFFAVFDYLGTSIDYKKFNLEGKSVGPKTKLSFELDFASALTGERIALNLLQRASSIATYTKKFVDKTKAKKQDIKILETRKTTPGLRSLEKYAVRVGGGMNHRFGQHDCFMIKDNHKNYFGSLSKAYNFFQEVGAFYNPTIVEIHNLKELNEAIKLNIKHVMLDNFSPELIKKAIQIKKEGMTYEVSGGIRLDTLDDYLISGVDAISVGALTYDAPQIDVSFKYHKKASR